MSDQGPSAYVPSPAAPLLFEDFQGINTATTRPGVSDKQMYWSDGWIPLAPGNLRTLYGKGSAIYTAPLGNTIVYYGFANIGPTPIGVMFLSSGKIDQVNVLNGVVTEIAPAGTILSPSRLTMGMSQYGDQYVIIVAQQTNGYWLWDGTTLYDAGSLAPGITLLSSGSGYTSAPTVSFVGGSGSGATAVASESGGFVTNVDLTNAGSGYLASDIVQVFFSGGSPTPGAVTQIFVLDGGLAYSTAPTISITGGGGSGATATANLDATDGSISSVTITNTGSGYTETPTVSVSGGGGTGAILSAVVDTVAYATVSIMASGVQGSGVDTYQGRVWVINGAQVFFTAPGSPNDFSSANGGGNFTSNSSFLRVGYVAVRAANGFLYLVGDSSVDSLSGVQTTGVPPVTTFQIVNVDPEVGTPWPDTVTVFGRNILFANSFGVHVVYGAAVTKISEPLDGVFNTVPDFGLFLPSSAKAVVFGKKLWMTLVPIIDPVKQVQAKKLFLWNGKVWFPASQDLDLDLIQFLEFNSEITAYGSDKSAIYPLFQTPTTAIQKLVQSRLWSQPIGYHESKTVERVFGLIQLYDNETVSLVISVDSEKGNNVQNVTGIPNTAGIAVLDAQPFSQNGALIGLTASTTAKDLSIISLAIEADPFGYRG